MSLKGQGFIHKPALRALVEAALCHGTAILAFAKGADGEYLVKGKTVTGFANVEEDFADNAVWSMNLMPPGKHLMPRRIEDRLKQLGANFIQAGLWRGFAIRDGNLITGQQNFSGEETARAVVEAACAASPAPSSRRPVELVHGAWMGAAAWDKVAADLRTRGLTVIAVELPGHGRDATPPGALTLAGYVDAVAAALPAQGPSVLVGHSMAGMVISAVAERDPARIATLVYVAAYLPQDNQSLYQLSSTDADTRRDNAVSYTLQKSMLASAGGAARVVELDTSHSPMLTQPRALADLIAATAAR